MVSFTLPLASIERPREMFKKPCSQTQTIHTWGTRRRKSIHISRGLSIEANGEVEAQSLRHWTLKLEIVGLSPTGICSLIAFCEFRKKSESHKSFNECEVTKKNNSMYYDMVTNVPTKLCEIGFKILDD